MRIDLFKKCKKCFGEKIKNKLFLKCLLFFIMYSRKNIFINHCKIIVKLREER